MKRILFILAVLILISVPLSAGTRSCTTSMVTLNICRSTSDVAYCLPISTVDPDAGGPKLPPSQLIADAFAAAYNWQTPAPCDTLMIDAGICTPGQAGQLVPITKAQFADIQVRNFVLQTVRAYDRQQKVAAAQSAADAEPNPDVGN